jgi:hypothetical protein
MGASRLMRKSVIWGVVGGCVLSISTAAFCDSIVISYCPDTRNFGIASHPREAAATEASLRNCNATGGRRSEGCCQVVGATANGCLALAMAPDGAYGVGDGDTEYEAISDAVLRCAAPGCLAQTARCTR